KTLRIIFGYFKAFNYKFLVIVIKKKEKLLKGQKIESNKTHCCLSF
ncbi:unnamed protein product, partial [Onchocerca flexuosa]|uniref:Transposase n=1 Tax=Onchocerca flexuosa TaxID=387005 RepID=A0A183I2Z1_9BILA